MLALLCFIFVHDPLNSLLAAFFAFSVTGFGFDIGRSSCNFFNGTTTEAFRLLISKLHGRIIRP